LQSFQAESSGGTLTAGGSAQLKGYSFETFRFDVYVDKVRIHYPEGLRSTVSGELHLQKEQAGSYLTGDIDILQGIYVRSFEESPSVFRYSRVPGFVAPVGAFDDVRLNIHLEADGTLLVRNNFADMQTSANLNLIGTINDPVITGRVEVESGEINFWNRDYEIVRGSLDFSNPYRTEPQLNFVAETRIREYQIHLTFTGTFDRIYHDITSDPPLPRDDLYALLGAGGTQRETQGVGISTVLLEEGAGIVAAPLASPIERGFRKAFGLQRFHIDPTYVQSRDVATARITLEKDISSNFSVTISTNLFTAAEEIILLQYQLTREIRITASKDEQARYGVDVLVTKSFE
jgi:autotransporter translocation and assembly factor TamB